MTEFWLNDALCECSTFLSGTLKKRKRERGREKILIIKPLENIESRLSDN